MSTMSPAVPSLMRMAVQLTMSGLRQPVRALSSKVYVTSREDDPYKLLGLEQPSPQTQLAAADIKAAFRKVRQSLIQTSLSGFLGLQQQVNYLQPPLSAPSLTPTASSPAAP
jgi:hypothetical protein